MEYLKDLWRLVELLEQAHLDTLAAKQDREHSLTEEFLIFEW
jgi:hypothetical protein